MGETVRTAVDPRKLALIRDPQVRAYVRAVLRKRGVRRQDRDDKVHDVMVMVLRARHIPLHDAQGSKRYAGGIARHIGIRNAHQRKKDGETLSLSDGEQRRRVADEVPPEVRNLARAADVEGRRLYGRVYDWFVWNRVHGETLEEIAARENVSPGYVRNRVSMLQRELPGLLKAGGIALVLLLLLGLRGRWTYEHFTLASPDTMTTLRQDSVPWDAAVLRARAERAAEAGAWQACLDDLDAAKAIDGEDRGSAERLRRDVLYNLGTYDVGSAKFLDAKPR